MRRRIVKTLALSLIFVLSYFGFAIHSDNTNVSQVDFLQVQKSLAGGEIGVGPLCMVCQCNVCFIEPDGWFVLGIIIA